MNNKSGFDIIRDTLKEMPLVPGVYRMIDANDKVLYVGKAKNLRNRVSNYVNATGLSTRIMRMIEQTVRMEIVVTNTESEALLLEANLIKKFKPRYNILLRDDKSFPYILLTGDHPYPQIIKHRGARVQKGNYFGPFASTGAVNETLSLLQKAFLLRVCSDAMFKQRTRPCLQYQIKRCSAPCVNYISVEEYQELADEAQRFLQGKSREIQEEITAEMERESAAMHYEKAAILRDRSVALTRVQIEHSESNTTLEEADLIALHSEGGKSCVQIFFYRGGQNFGNKAYFPAHSTDDTASDILHAFIAQFYTNQPPPPLLLVSHPLDDATLLEAALQELNATLVEIRTPERGTKKAVMDKALRSAREALLRHLAEHSTHLEMLRQTGELFRMDTPPCRIEVYDNSHIAGTHMVGAMICARPEGFDKKCYRRFTIRSTELTPGDDYAMLREVLTRRFTRLSVEDPEREKWPDLVLIDGGAGQLSVAIEVFTELSITNLTFAAIAKGPDRNAGREWFHLPGQPPFQLEPNTPVLHYLQRLRDEAHRFAIGSHRIKRSNAMKESSLDAVPGIGGSRKRALLQHFGSGKAVEAATPEDLMRVNGISRAMAEKIYSFFHA